MCMKTYDYKDEQKDVKGKAERLNAIHELQMMLTDQKVVVSVIVNNMDETM